MFKVFLVILMLFTYNQAWSGKWKKGDIAYLCYKDSSWFKSREACKVIIQQISNNGSDVKVENLDHCVNDGSKAKYDVFWTKTDKFHLSRESCEN